MENEPHENIGSISLGSVYYAMKFEFYWPGMKKDIEYVIKKGIFVKYTIGKRVVVVNLSGQDFFQKSLRWI
jgi:hypothetical protein